MLVKPAICLVLGVISTYFCSAYIIESEQFDEYMSFMLKDFENASAAFLGLIPEFKVLVNLIVSVVIHLFAILLFQLLKSSSISSLVKKILLATATFLFLAFCTKIFINLENVYEGYLIPTLIPTIFWIGYGCLVLLIYFKSQRDLLNLSK